MPNWEKLGGSCREYSLPRSAPFSKVKGWIRGNTKTGPALEVAVSHHQGRYGIEIMIESFFWCGTCSWVMIINGINKHVTEMTEETHEDHIDLHWRQYTETCCKRKTETNINDDDFFSNGYVTNHHGEKDYDVTQPRIAVYKNNCKIHQKYRTLV